MRFVHLAIEVLACVLLFSVVHFALMRYDADAYHFSTDGHRPPPTSPSAATQWLEALYFSLVTQSTVGYGSITPYSTLAKCVTSLQIATTLLFVIRWATLRGETQVW